MTKHLIGVMGPADKDHAIESLAQELGKALAEAGHIVLTGGRDRGVMAAAAKGAKAAGGTTVGVLPGDDASECCEHIDIPIVTGLGSARNNVNVLSSKVVVSVGMGPGTASEVALAIKAGKHVVLLKGGEEAVKFFSSLKPTHVHDAKDVATAISLVASVL